MGSDSEDVKMDDDDEELKIEEESSDENDAEGNSPVEDKDEHDGQKGTEEDADDDVEDEDGTLDVSYPDTSIDLQYTSGGKFQLQRGTSHFSSKAPEDFVHLGDGEVLDLRSLGRSEQDENRKQRLSAKERRQMRKKGASGDKISDDTEAQGEEGTSQERSKSKSEVDSGKAKQPITQEGGAKRGKKSKLKKIKEKYGDQDEEDRELMMQILGSAGAPKESKRKKGKGRKGSFQDKQGLQANTRDHKKVGSEKISTDLASNKNKTNDGGSEKTQDKNSENFNKSEMIGGESLEANAKDSLESFVPELQEGLRENGIDETAAGSGMLPFFVGNSVYKKTVNQKYFFC